MSLKVLVTGGTGTLGQAIIASGHFPSLLTPPRAELDITSSERVKRYFSEQDFDAVIHCAALARMEQCENNPLEAVQTNVMGTAHLVVATLQKEKEQKRSIRFIQISTDGVYPGTRGNYSEKDETIPYNRYGWTKLGAECVVRMLKNFCIIRTSFFDPNTIRYPDVATDMYSSKLPIADVVKAIAAMLDHSFVGIINIGGDRASYYERYKAYKPSLQPCRFEDIVKQVTFPIAQDASMNCELWKRIEQEGKE